MKLDPSTRLCLAFAAGMPGGLMLGASAFATLLGEGVPSVRIVYALVGGPLVALAAIQFVRAVRGAGKPPAITEAEPVAPPKELTDRSALTVAWFIAGTAVLNLANDLDLAPVIKPYGEAGAAKVRAALAGEVNRVIARYAERAAARSNAEYEATRAGGQPEAEGGEGR